MRASRPGRARTRLLAPLAVLAILGGAVAGALALRAERSSTRRAARVTTSVTTRPALPSGGPATAAWVQRENARPGSGDWVLTPGAGTITGYASAVSVTAGDRVVLYVSTGAPSFRVDAYRMGWYGGAGARLVWRSPPVPGRRQPGPTLTPGTNMVEARWSPSMTVAVDRTWPPGAYLLKLVASSGAQHHVPLTVRDDTSRAAFLVQSSVTTWQAYNLWGGYNLYQGGPHGARSERSRVVSFDRPYDRDGSADFLGNEYPLVVWAEANSLDVTYWTDLDLHRRPELVTRHRALLSLGHDEYWSTAMRRGAEAARDAGVNLVFFGANAVFRHIRLEPSVLGPDRHEVNYKEDRHDPAYLTNPREVTVDWRNPPLREPESTLIGQAYECNPVKADMVVFDTTPWVFSGTGLRNGSHLRDLVGTEYDRFNPAFPHPPDVTVLAHSPVTCQRQRSYSDMTFYSAPSGAGVFATGTGFWISHLGGPCPTGTCLADRAVTAITANVLTAFGAGPAGRAHPAVSNTAFLPQPPRAGIPTPSESGR